jgi:hypothetical protein
MITAREKLLTLFGRTLDPKIVILACVDDHRFDEDFLAKVTPPVFKICNKLQ